MKRESHGSGEEALVGKKGEMMEKKKKKSHCSLLTAQQNADLLPLTERCVWDQALSNYTYLSIYYSENNSKGFCPSADWDQNGAFC